MRPADSGRYPSGQRGQTVNLLAYAFGGSNPPLPTIVAGASRPGSTEGGLRKTRLREARAVLSLRVLSLRKVHVAPHLRQGHVVPLSGGNSSVVERQPSKLGVAGSNPVSRSRNFGPASFSFAHVAQSAERVLGKDEVSGSIPDMGSTSTVAIVTANGRK